METADSFTGNVLRHYQWVEHRLPDLGLFVPLLIGTGGNAGSQTVGTTSSAQTVTFNNPTAGSVTISTITASGDFVLQTAGSNPCSNGLAVTAGGSCNIAVAFSPTAGGTRNGTLTVNDNASGSPRTAVPSG